MNESNEVKVKIAVIGLGGRGRAHLKTLLGMEDVEVPAICDHYDDRLQLGVGMVETSRGMKPDVYKDHRELLKRKDIDGVLIATSWTTHAEVALAAMLTGKYVASEVGAASSVEECWELVRVSEQTGMPCMLLENRCYQQNHMAVLNMVKKGVFGELIHCEAGYQHDLRKEVVMGVENRHYRVHHYLHRNGDIYPTHALGPLCKYLGINRGNRFLTLTSMASKSRGAHEWLFAHLGEAHPLAQAEFTQGDIVTTMIKCAHGETILITQDTTLPRPYERGGRIQGTKGLWMQDMNSIHIEGRSPAHTWERFDGYQDEFEHPLWKAYRQEGIRDGHGGADYLLVSAFVHSVKNKIAPPIDVYDMACWRAVSVLSEQSIALGSQPLPFPDFTNGKWILRDPGPINKFSLNVVDESLFA